MLAALVSMMMATLPAQAAEPIVCDGIAADGMARLALGEGFKRFRAKVKAQIAPKGGPVLAFEYVGPNGRALLAVSVMAPPLGDGSYPPLWSTMIAGSAGLSRGNEFALTSEFEIDIRQDADRTTQMRLTWRDDKGAAREGGSKLVTLPLEEGRFDLSCSNGRFELSDVTRG